ncbi:MAG: proton-conducting transporter membrane subunit, partial [Thermoanaerobaculia bacterium]
MTAVLILAGIVLCAVSGIPALFSTRSGARASTMLIALGGIAGIAGSIFALRGEIGIISEPWAIPGGAFHLRVDALSAFFIIPVFVVAFSCSLYSERSWPQSVRGAGVLRLFFGLVAGALVLLMSAANAILFLAAWEIVAVGAFFLIGAGSESDEVRKASWLYLAASHIATLALFTLFSVIHAATGSWELATIHTAAHTGILPIVFALAVTGFLIKAGAMPFHVWLPGAHAGGPSHVSALMSGVVIKMGIYGLVRVLSLFDTTPGWFGSTILLIGIVSSILGVAFALAQHDFKRLLAYHSIENIGIILIGIGTGLIGKSIGSPALTILGFAGGLLHVWNHGMFKSLLFLGAGSAVHSSGTREIDRMGGLAHRMPWTAGAFLLGAVAISGLPPLNGFVSEWLLYLSSFTGAIDGRSLLVFAVAPALAITGALAVACFVKAFGVVFLGAPRTA